MELLVVEDDGATHEGLEWGLRDAGRATDTPANRREALVHARSEPYDAIVLDSRHAITDGVVILSRRAA